MGVIKIREYSSFRVCKEGEFQGARDGNYTILKEETFNALEQFILNCKNDKNEAVEVMNISSHGIWAVTMLVDCNVILGIL